MKMQAQKCERQKSRLPVEILRALADAGHAPGWNNRPRAIRRFAIAGDFGRGCTLYVVPFRRFAYRRQEQAAIHARESDGQRVTR